jgi:hypothetical protein
MRRELRWKRKGLHRLFFVFVLLPMLCVFPYLRVVNNPNEFVRVFTVMSLVENRTFKIDEQVKTWGWVNDMAHLKGVDGADHYFMVKAPGAVYLGLPGYVLFSRVVAPLLGKHYRDVIATPSSKEQMAEVADLRLWWLRMATWSMRIVGTQIPCFLFLLWFERYLRDFSPDPAIRYATVAAAGLGTNYLAYTHMFASHSQYAAVAFLAFANIERELRRSAGDLRRVRLPYALLAGFCTSACVTLEYHALFLTLVLTMFAAFALFRPHYAAFWVLGAIPGLGFMRRWVPLPARASVTPVPLLAFGVGGLLNVPHVMYFHWAAYGDPFTPGHQKLETARFAAEHKMGLWGILWPSWDHIKALAIDPGFGFFGMSPFMWLGLLSVPLLFVSPRGTWSQRQHLRIISVVWLACMAVVIGVNAGFVEWRAGWTVGPRYLVVCAPFFAFGGALLLERVAHGSRSRRALCRGVAGGLALAGVLTIGTVGLVYDTLPETIARPFAQFSIPMVRAGLVPHHIGEWFGWTSITPWYVVCVAMLLAPMVAALWPSPGDTGATLLRRASAFVVALGIGMVPAFSTPEDSTPLFKLHPSVAGLAAGWEPPGRDRLTALREEAERYGTRGIGPCLWYRVADLERTLDQDGAAAKDESRARVVPRDRCPKARF